MATPHEPDSDSISTQSSDDFHQRQVTCNKPLTRREQYRYTASGGGQSSSQQRHTSGVGHAAFAGRLPDHLPPPPDMTSRYGMPLVPNHGMSNEARRQSIMAIDRKRRLTGSNQDGNRRRHGPGGAVDHNPIFNRSLEETPSTPHLNRIQTAQSHRTAPVQQSPAVEVVDLTSSPPTSNSHSPLPPPRRTSSTAQGFYVVPRWQPDCEVAECPICKRPFSFLFRRHHCRKCGRVVCNDCSPHRITIPRQFIVNPPNMDFSASTIRIESSDTSARDEDDVTRRSGPWQHNRILDPAIGGGEKVRLCNPCVPDPQPDPHINYHNAGNAQIPSEMLVQSTQSLNRQSSHSRHHNVTAHLSEPFPGIPGLSFMAPSTTLPRSRPSRNHASTFDSFGLPPSMILPLSPSGYAGERHHERTRPPTNSHFAHGRYHSFDEHRMPSSLSSRPRGRSMFDDPPQLARGGAAHTTMSRQQLSEDDFCPVCRRTLPPRGPNGDETAREAHIVDCISSREPTNQTSTRLHGKPPTPPRGPMHMLTFVATEKDCVGEEGIAQECSICMVEYDVGDQLARLECLCKFHRECIVSWFERKQECPVHKIA